MKEVRVCWCVSEMPPIIQTTQTSSYPTPTSTHTTLYSFNHYLLTKDIHTTKDVLMLLIPYMVMLLPYIVIGTI